MFVFVSARQVHPLRFTLSIATCVASHLLLCNQFSPNFATQTAHIYFLSFLVRVGEFGCGSAEWFWPRVSHKVADKLLGRASVSSEGLTSVGGNHCQAPSHGCWQKAQFLAIWTIPMRSTQGMASGFLQFKGPNRVRESTPKIKGVVLL
jgi:hypothetical protein